MVDFGSTFTKVAVVNTQNGHLLCTGQSASTVATDVLDGFNAALADCAGQMPTVTDGPNAPNGNYTINQQSITAGTDVPCTSSITVNRQ